MSTIAERAQENLGLNFYDEPNYAELVGGLTVATPAERQYVLRCPVIIPGQKLSIPGEMDWCGEFIETSLKYQRDVVGVDQPFAYLTIRNGRVESVTDDETHVDGFSMRIPHIPEQNYIWTDRDPTIVEAYALEVPEDFDPLQHNLQYLIQDLRPANPDAQTLKAEHIYALDPYVFHRRPNLSPETIRAFMRLSLTAIPIDDANNYTNPKFGAITSDRDGVMEFRDKLERFPVAA